MPYSHQNVVYKVDEGETTMSDLVGVQDSRIRKLNQKPPKNDGDYVVYWMQSAVRTICNQALTYSIKSANESNCQLLVVFGLTETYPEANARHYTFMIEGLRDVSEALGKLRIPFIVLKVSKAPFEAVLDVTRCVSVREVITDFNYLRHLREWRATLAAKLDVALTQVETECVVPVELVSSKLEFAARTLRPKITGYMSDFFVLSQLPPLKTISTLPSKLPQAVDVSEPQKLVSTLPIDHSVGKWHQWSGGEKKAQEKLAEFLLRIHKYPDLRNDMNIDGSSQLSMYLHYGHISPVQCAVEARKKGRGQAEFVEELVVRRELSFNHCYYNPRYDELSHAVPEWAKKTMAKHLDDPREHIYSCEELEQAKTADAYWNAAQLDMAITGRMPNYLRMYWGKKIIEWSKTYDEAWKNLAYLNNKYHIDGRDANSWCNFAWCFGAKDRPWFERPILGQLRSMTADGLKRKYDIETYVAKINKLSRRGPQQPSLENFLKATEKRNVKSEKSDLARTSSNKRVKAK